MNDFITTDSGKREQYATGAQRDTEEGKGRFDLIPHAGLLRLAELYRRGAVKYDDHNWRKGIPTTRAYSSMIRHAHEAAEVYTCTQLGKESPLANEDHLAAVVFNAFIIIQNEADAEETSCHNPSET